MKATNFNNSKAAGSSSPESGANFHARRPPINLYPSPGTLHGSRKRKSSSRHGPESSAFDQSRGEMVLSKNMSKNNLDSQPKQNYVLRPDEVKNNVDCKNNVFCPPSPKSPLPMTLSPSCDFLTGSPMLKTPRNTDNTTPASMSPLSREMSVFRNLSLRSPKVAKSPASSFSQYTRSANTFILTATSQSSFDSCDMSKCTSSASPINKPGTPQNVRTVPLTVLSDSSNSKNKRSTLKSPQLILSPRPHRPSTFLQPSPKSSHLPFPKLSDHVHDEPTSKINHGSLTHHNNVHTSSMMPLSSSNKATTVNSQMEVGSLTCPPPIKMLSLDFNKTNRKERKSPSTLKRKTNINTAVSLLKPSSEDALNEMMYSHNGDTEGSLSDSDDEGAFFLSDPSCLTLKPNSYKDTSDKQSSSHCDNDLSLAAAYSFMGSKKTKRDDPPHEMTSHRNNFSALHFKPYCRSRSNDSLFSDDRDKSSSTSLFGMNIIHENSASNASLADMCNSFSRNKRSGSNRNLSDEASKESSSFLSRSKSNQSINSLGLCLEGSVSDGFECNNRDMITPPVISRPMSSPPPLKQTALTAKNII